MRPKKESPQFAAIFSNIFLIIGAFLYFIGWIYTYYYYTHFGIPFGALDIPFYYLFVYSYPVITHPLGLIIILLAVVLLYLSTSVWVNRWVPIVVLIALFPTFYFLGRAVAYNNAIEMRRGQANLIVFTFKDIKLYPEEFHQINIRHKLRLLTQTNDSFFVLFQPPDSEGGNSEGFVYIISKKNVILAYVIIPKINSQI